MENLLILIVVFPILMALVTSFSRGFIVPWAITLFTSFAMLVSTIIMFFFLGKKTVFYNVGNWAVPYGIQLRFDLLGLVMLLLINLVFFLVVLHSRTTIPRDLQTKHKNLFYCILTVFVAGMCGIIVSNDLFNIYVFLEITALSTYTLIGSNNKKNSLLAAFDYLIMGTLGSTFYLLGLGFLYAMTGTLNIPDMASNIVYTGKINTIIVGAVFMIVGLSIKSAVFPMHNWVSNAYTFAPSSFAAMLSGIGTKVNIYIMLRLLYQLFDIKYLSSKLHISDMLILSSVTGIIVCSLYAISRKNIRSVLANSSIAQIAYITICMSINTKMALTAAILHMINHTLAKTALFMIAANMERRSGSWLLDKMFFTKNIFVKIDIISFFICAASIVGVPFTIGFLSKWSLLNAAISSGNYMVVVVGLCGSIMALTYFGRILKKIQIFDNSNDNEVVLINEFYSFISPLLLSILILVSSFFGNFIISSIINVVKDL